MAAGTVTRVNTTNPSPRTPVVIDDVFDEVDNLVTAHNELYTEFADVADTVSGTGGHGERITQLESDVSALETTLSEEIDDLAELIPRTVAVAGADPYTVAVDAQVVYIPGTLSDPAVTLPDPALLQPGAVILLHAHSNCGLMEIQKTSAGGVGGSFLRLVAPVSVQCVVFEDGGGTNFWEIIHPASQAKKTLYSATNANIQIDPNDLVSYGMWRCVNTLSDGTDFTVTLPWMAQVGVVTLPVEIQSTYPTSTVLIKAHANDGGATLYTASGAGRRLLMINDGISWIALSDTVLP